MKMFPVLVLMQMLHVSMIIKMLHVAVLMKMLHVAVPSQANQARPLLSKRFPLVWTTLMHISGQWCGQLILESS